MESSGITLEINYTPNDFRPFLFRKLKGSIIRTAVFVFVALFAAYVVASHFVTDELSANFRLVAAAFLFAVPLITVGINILELERSARARAKRSPITLEVKETGITSQEEYRTATLEWPAYRKAFEYKDKFVILTDVGGLLVPKRCFDTEEQERRFREIVRRALNGAIEKG